MRSAALQALDCLAVFVAVRSGAPTADINARQPILCFSPRKQAHQVKVVTKQSLCDQRTAPRRPPAKGRRTQVASGRQARPAHRRHSGRGRRRPPGPGVPCQIPHTYAVCILTGSHSDPVTGKRPTHLAYVAVEVAYHRATGYFTASLRRSCLQLVQMLHGRYVCMTCVLSRAVQYRHREAEPASFLAAPCDTDTVCTDALSVWPMRYLSDNSTDSGALATYQRPLLPVRGPTVNPEQACLPRPCIQGNAR